MNGGDITYHFKSNTKDLDNSLNNVEKKVSKSGGTIKNIVAGMGITSIVSKAVCTISSSIDSAISRVDTLNNFPKVMELFGVSADEASESIDRIDKSVRGLPTSLDTAVAGVQDLFMVTKNLEQSEKLFQAVNDSAMVFANGSTDAVNRFIYAYKQSLSMGKVQAEEFNQMNEAIPGLMTKVAESIGVSYSELKDGLSDGSISIDTFNSALQKLDTEGSSSMTALQESAKTSTGGIQTSLTNFGTAITRGVGNMIQTINTTLEKNDLPNISEMIQIASDKISAGFKTINNIISKLPLKETIKLIKQLAPVILTVAGAVATYKTTMAGVKAITSIISGASKIMGTAKAFMSLIPAIKGVKSAFTLLNVAFNLSPIGIITTSIVALVAGFIYLWKHCEGFRNFWINLWDNIKSIVKVAIDFVVGLFNTIVDFVKNNWQGLLLFIVNPFAGAFKLLYDNCEGFRTFIDNLISKIKTVISNIINFVASIPSKIWNILTSLVSKIVSAFTTMKNKATEGAKNVFNAVVNGFKSLPSKMLDIGKNLVSGLWNGINNKVSWITDKVKGFGNSVIKSIKKIFGVHSPSRVFAYVGEMNMQGLYNGMDDMQPKIQAMIDGMFDLSPNVYGTASNTLSPNINVVNNVNVEQDPLGQMVHKIKTFSGGAKNDFNYGAG